MKELYIDCELQLERNAYNKIPDINHLVDKGAIRHLICNINPPDGYSNKDLYSHPIMVRILDEFDKAPVWTLVDIVTAIRGEESHE